MSEMVAKTLSWLVEAYRRVTPLIVCMFGMTAPIALSPGHVWMGIFIAALSFSWALDMSATRAEAKAKEETAAKFINAITSGDDTTITVEVIRRAALSEVEG